MKKFEMMDDSGKLLQPKSFTKELVRWFLILGLAPLLIICTFSFKQANTSLTRVAEEGLEQSAETSVKFIQNWFEYRLMDLKTQSESKANAHLLSLLVDGFKKSGLPLEQYVQSSGWDQGVQSSDHNLSTAARTYDYIHDLFLIDTHGNILFSVTQQSDLGTNLKKGKLSGTKFAQAVAETQETGDVKFSDVERYVPSDNSVAGFISAPIVDESGKTIGVFATQLKLDRIFNFLTERTSRSTSLTHYLVNKNRLLVSPLNRKSEQEVLERVINMENLTSKNASSNETLNNAPLTPYQGSNGKAVLGISQKLNLLGVEWTLVTEMNRDEALSLYDWLIKNLLPLILFLTGVLIVLAIYLARRITRPIIELEDISMKVASGDTDQHVKVRVNDEVGRLAVSFNYMLQMREMHEDSLEVRNQELKQVLSDLEQQKYALDQHAIVAITDIGGTITFANDKFLEVSGYERDELLGQNHRMLNSGFHAIQFFKDLYTTISNGKVWHGEICNRAKSGKYYWVDTTIVPFMGEDGPISYVAIRADITERKATEDALIEARIEAEMAVLAKSEFLASMSHEIRTPMNGVLGMIELLLNTKLTHEQEHCTKIAQNSAQSLLTLINDILDFSKVEAGKLDLEMIDFKLHDMLGNFAEAMALQAHVKGLELILDLTSVDETMVRGDPGRIRQILTNLVSNAIKFTVEGEIVIRASLKSENEKDWRLFCKVTDTGIGIPEDKLESLFDSFSQVDASTTRKYGGTGLGLSIVKKLSELMNGSVQASSVEGQGSSFEVDICLEKSVNSNNIIPDVDMASLKLLVVDDNATNREVLRCQFELWGATVIEAESGIQALKICDELATDPNERFFDIAFLDMQLPRMNGAELGKRLKKDQRFSNLKLVMMTSIGTQGDAKRFSELGFSAYFPKPATTADLFKALAVIAEDGAALEHAQPLVTHHYLKSLDSNKNSLVDSDRFESTIGKIEWPRGARILLVEDNQINQMVATGLLNGFGLAVDVTSNGSEAIKKLRDGTERYSLILMDCEMPQMDGYEATKKIRSGYCGGEYKDIPIMAMTANVMMGIKDKCMEAGMDDYVAKPIDPDLLSRRLQAWLLSSENIHRIRLNKEKETHKVLKVWDKDAALKRVIGDEILLKTVIDVFIKESPEQIKTLAYALGKSDAELIVQAAHGIKGVAGNLGGIALQHQSSLIEEAAKDNDIAHARKIMLSLEQAHRTLLDQFTEYFVKQESEANSTTGCLSEEELMSMLRGLEQRLEDSDYIDPQELEVLKQASAKESTKVLIKKLTSQISQFDNYAAKKTLQEIEKVSEVRI